MDLTTHLALILAAGLLDALLGDPVYRWHPIRLIGALSLAAERRLFDRGLDGRAGGLLHWLIVVGAALAAWWLVRLGLAALQPWLACVWDLFIAYSLLCQRDLLVHGRRVLDALDDLPIARRRLAMLVGRDTAALSRGGVVRATIESLAENLTDGVLTPLWALGLGGLPGLILVKAASTLDSMVGYRNARYGRFGWTAARVDDLLHWLPARLSAPLIALAAALLGLRRALGPGVAGAAAQLRPRRALDPVAALGTAWRDHGRLPSPNSGWSEAAMAGALRVRLVGPAHYGGVAVARDWLGDPDWPADLDADHLRTALALTLVSAILAVGVAGLLVVVGHPLVGRQGA